MATSRSARKPRRRPRKPLTRQAGGKLSITVKPKAKPQRRVKSLGLSRTAGRKLSRKIAPTAPAKDQRGFRAARTRARVEAARKRQLARRKVVGAAGTMPKQRQKNAARVRGAINRQRILRARGKKK